MTTLLVSITYKEKFFYNYRGCSHVMRNILPPVLVLRDLQSEDNVMCQLELSLGVRCNHFTLTDLEDQTIQQMSDVIKLAKHRDKTLTKLSFSEPMMNVIKMITFSINKRNLREKRNDYLKEDGTQIEPEIISNCLFLACFAGDMDTCAKIVNSDLKYRVFSDYSNSPLHVAAHNGKMEIVKFLVKSGFPVTTRNASDDTAMNLAAKRGFCSIASFLWSHHWVPDVPPKTPNKKKDKMHALAEKITDKVMERERSAKLVSSSYGLKAARLPPINFSGTDSLTSNSSQSDDVFAAESTTTKGRGSTEGSGSEEKLPNSMNKHKNSQDTLTTRENSDLRELRERANNKAFSDWLNRKRESGYFSKPEAKPEAEEVESEEPRTVRYGKSWESWRLEKEQQKIKTTKRNNKKSLSTSFIDESRRQNKYSYESWLVRKNKELKKQNSLPASLNNNKAQKKPPKSAGGVKSEKSCSCKNLKERLEPIEKAGSPSRWRISDFLKAQRREKENNGKLNENTKSSNNEAGDRKNISPGKSSKKNIPLLKSILDNDSVEKSINKDISVVKSNKGNVSAENSGLNFCSSINSNAPLKNEKSTAVTENASEECFNEWLRRKRETEERRRREENERMESETREVMRKWKEWKAGPRVMSHRKWSKIKDGEDKIEELKKAQSNVSDTVETTISRAEKSSNDRIFYDWLIRKEVQELVRETKELKIAKRNRKKSLNNINKMYRKYGIKS